MQAAFYGIGAAVIGIITKSAYKLARVTLGRTAVLWALCIVMGSVTVITGRENVWLFILCGFAALVVLAPPKALSLNTLLLQLPAVAGGVSSPDILLFFAKAGAFVFGSGLAIVPFLHGSVVEDYHWLNERQFLDAVAVAMITPGPVVITVGFIGYLVGNFSGAAAAAVGVFLPVWLVVVLLTPLYEKFASHPQVAAFVRGVTSAATGAIAGAVIVLGQRALVDLPTMLIGGGTLLLLVSFRIPEPFIVLAAGSIGILLHTLR
jgi:chromate transporter